MSKQIEDLGPTALFTIAKHAEAYPRRLVVGVLARCGVGSGAVEVMPLFHSSMLRPTTVIAANAAKQWAKTEGLELLCIYVVSGSDVNPSLLGLEDLKHSLKLDSIIRVSFDQVFHTKTPSFVALGDSGSVQLKMGHDGFEAFEQLMRCDTL